MISKQDLVEWKNEIASVLERHVRPLFAKEAQYKFTFIARIDGHEESDILITEEDSTAEIIYLLERSTWREKLR